MPVATILVTDLVGSTALRARLGEEQAERLRRLHDRLVRAAIETHGGEVIKGLGDGMVARFAEASRAVAAAVAIQQTVGAHTGRHPDRPLVVRVGLSAGDVHLSDADCFGRPVVEATQLCAAAGGGRILAADVVRAVARSQQAHAFVAAGEVELEGLSDPVAAVEVTWAAPAEAAAPLPDLLGTGTWLGFTGRSSELDVLDGVWATAAGGGRGGVVIGGEPGVGKTRLAGEFARRVHEAGAGVLYGRCQEGLGVPYEPFVEALTFFSQHTAAHDLRFRLGRYPGELVRLLPDLGELVPGLDPPLRSDPETEQYRLFEAVASWLVAAAEAAGLALVVDDLQWAPPPTLQLLSHVLRAAGPARLLVLATFRDTEVGRDHPLAAVLADLRRVSGIERISLGGLGVDEVAELIKASGHPTGTVAEALHEATLGNPFFVGEVLRHMAESGVAAESLPVPESAREVITSRVARLAPTTGDLLAVAAVFGRDLELAPLAIVADVDPKTAVEALDQALAARLVEETRAGSHRFVHDLVRSALYEGLSATKRAQLHLRAADVFEADPARLAHHLVASAPLGNAARTARACLAAGDRALGVLADAEADDWYAKGLVFAHQELSLRIDLLTGLGEAQRRTGGDAWRQTLLDASRLAAEHGDVTRLVRAVLANSRGTFSVSGDVDEERLELIQGALDLVGPAPSAERAELLSLQAAESVFVGDHERVLRAADESASIAERIGDVTVQARVGVRCFLPCLVPDRVVAMASQGAELTDLTDATGDPHLRTWSRVFWAMALLEIGDLGEARRRGAEAMAIAEETGQPGLRWIAHLFSATPVDAVGEHDEAKLRVETALELGQQAGYADAVMVYAAGMWLPWAWEGQSEVATALAAQAYAAFPAMVVWQGAWAVGLGLTGRTDELAGFVAGLPHTLCGVPVDLMWLTAHFWFAVAQGFGVDNPQAAAVIYDRLLPYRALHVSYGGGYVGPIETAFAITARVMGDHQLALTHHEAAAATITARGAARARALNGYQWTRTLLACGDPRRAEAMAQETLTYCRAKGYTTFVTKTEELLGTIQ